MATTRVSKGLKVELAQQTNTLGMIWRELQCLSSLGHQIWHQAKISFVRLLDDLDAIPAGLRV